MTPPDQHSLVLPSASAIPRPRLRAPRLYAILRTDISMSPGKAVAQAGHAFVDVLLAGLALGDGPAQTYARLRPGTKITLGAPLAAFDAIELHAAAAGIPVCRVIDRDHVELPDFDGSPIPTALGLGPFDDTRPVPRDLARVLDRARLWPATPTPRGD